eukprot:Pgem_evm1s14204
MVANNDLQLWYFKNDGALVNKGCGMFLKRSKSNPGGLGFKLILNAFSNFSSVDKWIVDKTNCQILSVGLPDYALQ